MTKLTYKEQVTQTVVEQLEGSYWTFENAMKKWWQNPRRDAGLRLSPMGNQAFQTAGIEYSDHEIKKIGKSYYGFVIELSKKIKCPYYIDVSKSETGNIQTAAPTLTAKAQTATAKSVATSQKATAKVQTRTAIVAVTQTFVAGKTQTATARTFNNIRTVS